MSIESFTVADFQTEVWRKLKRFMNERLEQHRELNDLPKDEMDTAVLRGRIGELKFLLALPEYTSRSLEAQDQTEPGDIASLY